MSHTENFGDLNLRHAALLQNGIDLQGKLSFEQFLFGVGKSKVRKDVSAAFGYVSDALACFFAFGFISVLPFSVIPFRFCEPLFRCSCFTFRIKFST